MSEQLAAFPESPQHTQTVSLGGVQFRVTFTFRDRTSRWYMDLRLRALAGGLSKC